jgi:branched-chain amino acid transport system permease protein
MDKFLQLLFSGAALGSVYGLIALGFVVIYKATRVFNFAQGDLVMVGAFLAVTTTVTWGLPFWIALPVILLIGAALGSTIHVVFMRPLIGRPLLAVVMVTIAISLIIQAVVQIVYGPRERVFESPIGNRVFDVGGVAISSIDLASITLSAIAVAVFGVFFRFTPFGLKMRAVAEHPEAALLSGVNANRVSIVAWSVGTALAALGGVVLASTQLVTTNIAAVGLLAFPAIVLGGFESLPGAVVGGILVGVVQTMAAGYISPDAESAVVYAVLLIMLLVRPQGLFGQREIVRV